MAAELADINKLIKNLNSYVDAVKNAEVPSTIDKNYVNELQLVSKYYYRLGIAVFLAEFNVKGFSKYLNSSVETYLDMINYSNQLGAYSVKYKIASDITPFFCSICIGNLSSALEITKKCNDGFFKDYEIEEDYWYAKFFHKLLESKFVLDPSFEDICRKFLVSTDDEGSCRYQVCNAIVLQDEKMFNESLDALINEYKKEFEEMGADVVLDLYKYRTEQFVFVEGLALRAIGEKMGFKISEDKPLMPKQLRVSI